MCKWGVQWQLLVCKKLIDSEMWRYVHNNVWRVGCNEWVNLWITGVSEHNCGPWQEGSATVELLKARATVMYVAGRNGEVRKVLNTCMREQDIKVNECVSVWWWKDPVGGYDDTWILWELRSLGLSSILRKYCQSYALFDTVKCSGGMGAPVCRTDRLSLWLWVYCDQSGKSVLARHSVVQFKVEGNIMKWRGTCLHLP